MAEPFFIVGFQRSGTTLIRMMLDSHPDVAVPLDTTGLWLRWADRAARELRDDEPVEKLVDELLKEERIQLWKLGASAQEIAGRVRERTWPAIVRAFYEAYAEERGKRIWGDKDPGNMVRLHVIDRWFPGCRFIHIIRDGRDACLSQLKQDFGYSLVLPCAAAWREQVWWVNAMGELLGPERYHQLRYEDLIERPEEELRRVTDFLGIEYTPSMLQYHERVRESIPDEKRHLWPLIDRPPQSSNAGGWKTAMSPSLQVCFEKRAGPLLSELGYSTTQRASGAYFEEVRQMLRGAVQTIRRRL